MANVVDLMDGWGQPMQPSYSAQELQVGTARHFLRIVLRHFAAHARACFTRQFRLYRALLRPQLLP